jgi:hypothetical protein
MNRPLTALALVGGLLVGGAVTAAPASAADDDVTYYSLPFSGDLLRVEPYDGPDSTRPHIATFAEWQADGLPRPVRADVRYHAYTWSPDVYADLDLPVGPVALKLTYGEWRAAGSPRPVTTGLSATSAAFKWASSSEVFVGTYSIPRGDGPHDSVTHKLTFAEYRHLGYPSLAVQGNEGDDPYAAMYVRKLSWTPSIVLEYAQRESAYMLDYDEWASLAFPTPQIVASFPGDRFCQTQGSADITYRGYAAEDGLKLTFGQWLAAGSPKPTAC